MRNRQYQKLLNSLVAKSDPQFKFINLHGRPVFVRPIMNYEADNRACDDCGTDANLVLFELGDQNPWYWCGYCDIGG